MNTPANIKIVIKKYTINFLINFLVFIKNLLKILKILIKKSLKTIINISYIKYKTKYLLLKNIENQIGGEKKLKKNMLIIIEINYHIIKWMENISYIFLNHGLH
jgi:hypothetical protein